MPKTDILCLRRRDLLQMVNNCGFGQVLTIQQLRYYCDNNDIRGTSGQGVSLLRYAAMLTCEYFQPAAKPKDYIEQKRIQAEKNAEAVRAAQDIGSLPEVAQPERKESALASGEQVLPQFTLVAYTGVKVQTKDFPCPIVVDLQGIDIPVQKIPVRFEHKSFQGVGHTEKIVIVAKEVLADGVISRDTSWARDVAMSAKNGFPWQASMGGPIHEAEYIPFGQKVTVNGEVFEGEIYVIRKMTLKEISFVDLGADPNGRDAVFGQQSVSRQQRFGLVSVRRSASAACHRSCLPQRARAADHRTGRRRLQLHGRSFPWRNRLRRQGAGPSRRLENGPVIIF